MEPCAVREPVDLAIPPKTARNLFCGRNQRLENVEKGKQIARKFEQQAALQQSKMQPNVRMPRPEAGIAKETLAEIEKALNLF